MLDHGEEFLARTLQESRKICVTMRSGKTPTLDALEDVYYSYKILQDIKFGQLG